MAYDVGQVVRLPLEARDADGNLVDATITLDIARDDGTTFPAPALVHDGTGLYHADVVTDSSGVWSWEASTPAGAVGSGQWYVRIGGPALLSLVEAKKQLNKPLTVTTDDDELRDWIDAVTYVIERRAGAVVRRTVVEYHDGGTWQLTLRRGPVITVSEVREIWGPDDVRLLTAEPEGGTPTTNDQYLMVTASRTLVRRSYGAAMWFPPGTANVRVSYVVGRSPVPPNYRLAAAELLTHHWRNSQLAAGATRVREDALTGLLTGVDIPNRVMSLIGTRKAPRLGR